MLIGYDLKVWHDYNLKAPIKVDATKLTHVLLTGSSGSGKSYALKWILKNLVTTENIKLTFCNFKDSSDFRFLKSNNKISYYTVGDCLKGFESYYDKFKQAQDQSEEYNGILNVLIFDEFPAFISWLTMIDKKQAVTVQTKISEMLMLARSYGFCLYVVMQRPDVKWLPDGSRDNVHIIIALGELSKEAKSMLFSGYDIDNIIFTVGEGMIRIDGIGLKYVKFPRISNLKTLEQEILINLL